MKTDENTNQSKGKAQAPSPRLADKDVKPASAVPENFADLWSADRARQGKALKLMPTSA